MEECTVSIMSVMLAVRSDSPPVNKHSSAVNIDLQRSPQSSVIRHHNPSPHIFLIIKRFRGCDGCDGFGTEVYYARTKVCFICCCHTTEPLGSDHKKRRSGKSGALTIEPNVKLTRRLRQSSRRCTRRCRRRRCRGYTGQGPAWCSGRSGTWAAAWWSS